MNKRIIALLTVVFMLALSLISVSAAEHPSYVVDGANVLTDSEEARLSSKLENISNKFSVDIAVVTVESLGGELPAVFAEDYYYYNGYGYGEERDGIMLLFSAEVVDGGRDYYVYCNGLGYDAVYDEEEDLTDAILGYLRNDDFVNAFNVFADECEYYVNIEINGVPFSVGKNLAISLAIGFVVALISVSTMKGKLKTVHFQTGAQQYQKYGSLNITDSRDIFLYKTVTSRQRPKSNSSGGSRSGGSRSGGFGGKC